MEKITGQVILDFNQGKSYAFVLVFNTYFKAIVSFAEKITGSRAEAEDLAIDVFVNLFERCQQFNTDQHIKAFLYVCARKRCLNYLKEQKRYNDLRKEFVLYVHDGLNIIHDWKNPLAVVVTIGGRTRAVAQVVQAGHIVATFGAAEIVPEKEEFVGRRQTASKLKFDVKYYF